jgi:MinD-like ATPase involved in chromosome partitioning or flagellar assembly
MLIALAVPGLDAEAIEWAVLRAGHRVAWRAADSDEVLTQLATLAPDAVLLADHPAVATATVVGSCDLLGVRSCLVVDDQPISVGAARLELADVLRVGADGQLDLAPLEAGAAQAIETPPMPGSPPATTLAPPARATTSLPPVPPMPRSSTGAPARVGAAEPHTAPASSSTTVHSDLPVALRDSGLPITSDAVAPSAAVVSPLVVTVWGPTGAPGRTTIAIGLAAELAVRGHAVCLIDADTYGGTIAPALGLLDEAPGFAAACRLAGSDSLDHAELDRVGQTVGRPGHGEFAVLTGIGRPHRWPELSASRVTAVIEQCRSWRSIIVIDAGFSLESDEEVSSDLAAPRRNAATIASLRAADHVVAVGAGDPLGLARFLRTHADLLETLETARVQVAINRVRASVLGIDPHGQVRQTLDRFVGVRDAVLIDDDTDAADAALLTARPVTHAAARSALSRGIAELADRLVAPAVAARPARAPTWWRRTG